MNLWLTVYRVSIAVLTVLLILFLVVLFTPKIRQNKARQREITRLEELCRDQKETALELRRNQERFKNDPGFVEKTAREELGKAKPGETIFRFSHTNDAGAF